MSVDRLVWGRDPASHMRPGIEPNHELRQTGAHPYLP